MKRLIPLLAALLLLSGCSNNDTPADPSPTGDTLTSKDVQAIYHEAAQVYDWFTLCPLPTTEESVEVDGLTYHPVNDEHIKTYAELEAKVRSLFSPTLADQILTENQTYRDIDGKLYCAESNYEANPLFYDTTVHVDHPDEEHFTVELLFWGNHAETVETPIPESDQTQFTTSATFGYSQEVLNYEMTDDGFRFTSFCPSDDLDSDANTIYTFDDYNAIFENGDYKDFDDWQLLCYLVNADGAYAEAPCDELLMRFLTRPQDILRQLATLYESPFYGSEDYSHLQILAIHPAYGAAYYLYPDEQPDFITALDACQPETPAEQTVLELMRSTFNKLTKDMEARPIAEEFALLLPGGTIPLTLGEQEGSFPWGYDLQGTVTNTGPADTYGTGYDMDCGELQLSYCVGKDGIEYLTSITTAVPYDESEGFFCTPRGFQCGYTEEHLQRAYLHAVKLDRCDDPNYDCCYVYEPIGDAFCKHIAFYLNNGIVEKIEIGDLLDGRILE